MILDAGPLQSMERKSGRQLFALLKRATERKEELHTSHAVLAQVWRKPERQVLLARTLPSFTVHALDNSIAIGKLLGRTGTTDVVDAHLATLAQSLGDFVLTSDPSDLTALGTRVESY